MFSALRLITVMAGYEFIRQSRQYRFFLMIGFTLLLGYLLVPSVDAGYLTMHIDGVRGLYNSAWLGALAALCCTIFLWLLGFYYLRGSIADDRRSGMGAVIVASPITNIRYLFAKTAGNFIILTAMALILVGCFIVMQYIRMEDAAFSITAYILPFLYLVLPALAVLSALTIVFDTLPFLRGITGNIVFFFVWTGLVITGISNLQPWDALGIGELFASISQEIGAAFPDVDEQGINFGYVEVDVVLTMVWKGMAWSAELLKGRLLWLVIAVGLVGLSWAWFRRNALLESNRSGGIPVNIVSAGTQKAGPVQRESDIRGKVLLLEKMKGSTSYSFVQGWKTELLFMIRSTPLWWRIAALILIAGSFFLPEGTVNEWQSLLWVWPVIALSKLGSHERLYRTESLLLTSPYVLRHLGAAWMAGLTLLIFSTCGVMFQLVVSQEWETLLACLIGLLFVPTFALAAGIWSGGRKLFEVVYVFWWYVGPLQQGPYFDFTGIKDPRAASWYLLLTLVLACVVYIGRRRQLCR